MLRSASAQLRLSQQLSKATPVAASLLLHCGNKEGCDKHGRPLHALSPPPNPWEQTTLFSPASTPVRLRRGNINQEFGSSSQSALFSGSAGAAVGVSGEHNPQSAASELASSKGDSGEGGASGVQRSEGQAVFEYTAPFADAVRRVKALSVASLGITSVCAPILVALQDSASMSLGAKAGIAATLIGFGTFTTGLLHWFASPYVRSLRYDRTTRMISTETLDFFAQKRHASFHISEVEATESLSPVSTFQARGKTYYVDPNFFTDKQLLSQLSPGKDDVISTETESGSTASTSL